MTNTQTKVKSFNVIFFVACILAFIMSGCSPFDGLQVPTATAQPTATEPAQIPTATQTILSSSLATCTVTTGYDAGFLNLRRGAGTQYGVIRVLREGESLQVIA